MKNAATKLAFTSAMVRAVIISKGAGIATYLPRITVNKVRNTNAAQTAQSWPEVEI